MTRTAPIVLVLFMLSLSLSALLVPPRVLAAQPEVRLYKSANPGTVSPGDQITYPISFNNLGPQTSPIVWINDTLPPEVTYVNDSAYLIYGVLSGYFVSSQLNGNVLSIKFVQIPTGNHSFFISADVTGPVADGQVLTNKAAMNYTSSGDRWQPEAIATAAVTASTPVMHLDKTVELDSADPTRANFSFAVSNTGSANAVRVWVNDSLPSGLVYVSSQVPPAVTCVEGPPGTVSCVEADFAPGNEVWKLIVRITPAVPPDTTLTNWAFLNATSAGNLTLPTIAASAAFVSQTARIDVAKVVDQNRALPGSNIHYFIYYNNTGTFRARNVWVNDTLPSGVSVVSVNPAPVLNSSGRVNWYFTNVSTGVHAVSIEVSLATTLANGTALNNLVSVDYFDAVGRKRPRSTQSASTTVTFDIPSIGLVKVASSKTVEPGGQVAYTIYYNNTGTALASTVSIEDTLPGGVQILNANPAPTSSSGNRYSWILPNVIPGVHSIAITIGVDEGIADGTQLVNTASVTYTDNFGQIVGTNFGSVVVTVKAVPPPPPPSGGSHDAGVPIWLVMAAVFVAIVVVVIAYLARRRGAAEIDDIFLLHRDGLLIRHFTRKLNPEVDSDILGGMLIAVQNFVNESFASDRGLAKEGGLDELKFGKYSILLTRGKHVVMAAVTSAGTTGTVVGEIRAAIDDLEKNLGSVLEKWSGDMGQVTAADKYLQDLMAHKYRGRGK